MAVGAFGLHPEPTGRNDLHLGAGNGNAFYKAGSSAYHHGTILVNCNRGMMGRYLSVDESCCNSVTSVPARVVNLASCVLT